MEPSHCGGFFYSMRFIFIFIFLPLFGMTQVNDSIIYLRTVDINKDKSERKIIRHQTKGEDCGNSTIGDIEKLVNRMDDIPQGTLKALTFYIDLVPTYVNNNRFAYHRDLEMGLLLYEVGEDGKPGKSLTEKEIRFVIPKYQKGDFTIDLNQLQIQLPRSIFIGFQAVTNLKEKKIKIQLKRNDKVINYSKSWNDLNWNLLSNKNYPCWFRVSMHILEND